MKLRFLIPLCLLLLAAVPGMAASHATSVNVALIPNTTGAADYGYNWGGGSAGQLMASYFPGFNITVVHPFDVTQASDLAGYDTVILYQYCNVNTVPGPAFTNPLMDWLKQYGGKLIIWDSDSCGGTTTYSWLAAVGATFDRFSPGQTGSFGGSLNIVDDNHLGSADPTSPYYLNTAALVSYTDAVGDLNVVDENTVSPVWCATMRGVNILGRSGFAHMYTKIGSLTGAPDALIIYCGLDTDYISYPTGGPVMQKLFNMELAHGWGPAGSAEVADLGCQVPIGNLSLTPATATSDCGVPHTLTATVTRYDSSSGQTIPQAGATVYFLIVSGVNVGMTGSGVSDAAGIVTFTYTSSTVGTDIIQATVTINSVAKTATAEKVWTLPPPPPCPNAVTVNVYSNYTSTVDTSGNVIVSGAGAPYSGFAGSFSAPNVLFATSSGYDWHPFGLVTFGATIHGAFKVAADATYMFTLNSDDGSLLLIDGAVVVQNGDIHPPAIASGAVSLTAGTHCFEIQFFECCGNPSGVDLILPAGVTYYCPAKCAYSQGYWKNTKLGWPVTQLTLGSATYSVAAVLDLLNTATGSDKKADASLILVKQLIAAKLNIANGSDPDPVYATIAAADAALNGTVPMKVLTSSVAGGNMVALARILDQYNNGLLTCHCTP